jgi:hypothetical protein
MNDPRGTALADPLALALAAAPGIVPAQLVDDGAIDAQTQIALPVDHPAWQRDVVGISARARAVLASLRPVVVKIVTFWDHVARSVRVGDGRRVEVDPSGCYRLL